MSGLINKAKEVLSSNKNDKHDNPHSANYGPHGSDTGNRVDPRVDSDLDGRNNPHSAGGTYGTHTTGGAYGGHSSTGGAYGSQPAHGNTYASQTYADSSNAGPHKSSMMNKLDPRVDSDRDHRNDPSSTYGSTTSGGAYTGQTYSGSTNAGPHSSNMMNKADPRVDSDRDHRNDPTSTYGSSTGGGAYTGQTHSGSTNAGPHGSNFANKMDPRVDSDYDNRNDPTSRVGGYGGQENYGASGANPASGGYSSHTGPSSGLAASSVSTDYDNRSSGYGHSGTGHTTGGYGQGAPGQPGVSGMGGAYGSGTQGVTGTSGTYGQHTGTHSGYNDNVNASVTPGTGTAQQTAGPHNSNLMNKLDPRVDSDLDGSKTYGGNQTHR